MKIDVGKFVIIVVYLCVLVVGDGLYLKKQIQPLTAKVNELLVEKQYRDDKKPQVWDLKCSEDNNGPVVKQCNGTDGNLSSLLNWRNIGSKIANNWWIIIALSFLLPLMIFYTMQLVNGRQVNVQRVNSHLFYKIFITNNTIHYTNIIF